MIRTAPNHGVARGPRGRLLLVTRAGANLTDVFNIFRPTEASRAGPCSLGTMRSVTGVPAEGIYRCLI